MRLMILIFLTISSLANAAPTSRGGDSQLAQLLQILNVQLGVNNAVEECQKNMIGIGLRLAAAQALVNAISNDSVIASIKNKVASLICKSPVVVGISNCITKSKSKPYLFFRKLI